METNKFKEKALDYFKRHPHSEECHISSDGRVFHKPGDAQSFAGTLKNSKIESYQRDVVLAEIQADTEDDINLDNEETTKIEGKTTVDDKTSAKTAVDGIEKSKDFLMSNDVADMGYNTMQTFVKVLDLEVENQKKETLIVALEAFKKTLNEQ